jgi:hypothetical protein
MLERTGAIAIAASKGKAVYVYDKVQHDTYCIWLEKIGNGKFHTDDTAADCIHRFLQ